jgi:mRNA interferase RelE/StbE
MEPQIARSLEEYSSGEVDWTEYDQLLFKKLRRLWHGRERPTRKDAGRIYAPPPRPELLEWRLGFTPTFQKSIKRVDKALQGRVLDAIIALSKQPMAAHGDTIKPLEGDFEGLWRYRIGDYRLVYQLDVAARTVVLLYFSARGSAY